MNDLKIELKELVLKVAKITDMTPDDISDDMALFGEGLSLDSIDLLEFVVNLEKKYGITIRNADEGKLILKDINSISAAVMKHKQAE